MEHKVGERFRFRGKIYEVRERPVCMGCAFFVEDGDVCKKQKCTSLEDCSALGREDKKSVIFVKV